MKKIVLIIITVMFFTACEKEIDQVQSNDNNQYSTQRVAITTVYNLMLVPNDPAEESVNLIMYDWAVQVKGVMGNQTTYTTMLNQLKNDADYTMSFQDLQITPPITEFVGPDGITYKPFLWLYNGEKISSMSGELPPPYLCIGTDVDAVQALGSSYAVEDDDQETDDEFIAGWNFANIDTSEVINETEAEGIDAPIFIVVFSEEDTDNSKTSKKGVVDHPIDPMPTFKRYWVKSEMMDHRYERGTPRSEVKMFYRLEINGDLKSELRTPRLKVHKKHLNDWITCSFPILWAVPSNWGPVWQAINDNDDVKLLGVVFERDWWAYKKWQSVSSQNTPNVVFKYRAKYTDDYYEILNGVDLSYLSNGDTYIGSNVKIFQDL
jgi:hypothetical protein